MKKWILILFMLTATVSLADEIYLKDGSVVRGKLVEIKANEFYRIKTKDGSEFVYTVDKVDKVEFTKEAEKPAAPAPSQSWGVIGGGAAPGDFTGSGWDNTSGQFGAGKNYVKDASFGFGLGKYGTIGAELNLRSSDAIGFSLGLGAQYYSVTYESYDYYWDYYDSGEDSGFAAMGGAKLHFYFTPRTQPSQHNIFLAGYYGEAIGPAFGVAYGYEGHRESGGGWDFSIGLAIAPSAEEYMAEKVGAYEGDIDFTWIPILIELGFFF